MTTSLALKRALLRRGRTISAAALRSTAPFRVEVAIRPKAGHSFAEAKAEADAILDDEGHVAVVYDVVEDDGTSEARTSTPLPVQLASVSSGQSRDELMRTLVALVPPLGRAVLQERDQRATMLVAHEDGRCSPDLVDRVDRALSAVGYAGLPFEVAALPEEDTRNDLATSGFGLPRRDADIVRHTEDDEHRYAHRIRRLMSGDERDDGVGLLDNHVGTRIFATAPLRGPLPLGCLLPLYDRLFVEMPLSQPAEGDYFEHYFRSPKEDFLACCAAGRVIPVFKFNLGSYPRAVVEPWLTDLSLPLLYPRDYDYLAIRHLWRTSPHFRLVRDNRDLADVLRAVAQARRPNGAERALVDAASSLLWAAESMDGVAWHRGHLALGALSPGGFFAQVVAASSDKFPSEAVASTVTLDAFGASAAIATAQAFGASLTEATLTNEKMLELMLPQFGAPAGMAGTSSTEKLRVLISSLQLHFSTRIPAKEYLDVLDLAETRRIRAIVGELLEGAGGTSELELRERVLVLNDHVKSIAGSALEEAFVDAVGDVAAKSGTVAATAIAGPLGLAARAAAEILLLAPAKKLAGAAFEALIDDTRAGDALDSLRGAINGVPPAAIRLYRLRKKLGT